MEEETNNNANLGLDENNVIHNFEKILNLTIWASIISRSFFVIGIAILIFHLYDFLINFNLQYINSNDILGFLVVFGLILLFIFLGLILQFIVEGIYLLIDIEQNTRNKG
jgi:type III secretory pathway component EscU